MNEYISNRSILLRAARVLSAALLFFAGQQAVASPSGPLGCGGTFGVGGCAPYAQVIYGIDSNSGGGGVGSLFEYDNVILDYSVTGPTAAVRGVVDLASGSLKAFASGIEDGNVSTGSGGLVIASGTDVFTLHGLPGSGPIAFSVVLTANGTGNIANDGYSGQATVQLGKIGGGGGSFDSGVFQSGNNAPLGSQFSILSTISGQQLKASDAYSMLLDTPFSLSYSLRADVTQGTTFDLSNTAHLGFILPAGVSITSMGGYSSVIAVPEPETYVMLMAGLGLMGAVARRRKNKAA